MSSVITTNQERLQWYLEAEQKILQQQSVKTAEDEELTLACLATVRKEIERLQRIIALQAQGGRRSMIRRHYLE
ncbi:conserved hypothetical protein [Vibrio crassostreae]|nr:conserved hypothetical protein [Vibrio crassostreae]CAK1692171.1 conserved hypothetical protein [Vibrio crassostreae]CAK1709892.1 conserved hypothetical protein [Vibrio crassostreae]CAK1710191.1 conserved hypothetical protein [Vibrio crassostreae]CAK1725152.1 conserved hypothetical protein [Vibrio crassostreae]